MSTRRTFLHAADLHLDSPLKGLSRYPGAPVDVLRGASRTALTRLVDRCLETDAAFLVLAGDLLDGDWRDAHTGLFLAAELRRLRDANIPVAFIRGNHDAASIVTRRIPFADHVIELSTERPQTHVWDELGVAVHGQGFARRDVPENLARNYPAPVPGLLNVGLLHTSLDGRPGHDPYAPCRPDDLVARGYDYWALGHVHTTEFVRRDPWIVYPGCLQGRHAREDGPKGCVEVTYDVDGVIEASFVACAPVEWARVAVRLASGDRPGDALDAAVEAVDAAVRARPQSAVLAVRLRMEGPPTPMAPLVDALDHWRTDLWAAVSDRCGASAWVGPIDVMVQEPPTRRGLDVALGEMVTASADDETLAAWSASLDGLRRKLPPALLHEGDPTSLESLRARLPEVEALLRAQWPDDEATS